MRAPARRAVVGLAGNPARPRALADGHREALRAAARTAGSPVRGTAPDAARVQPDGVAARLPAAPPRRAATTATPGVPAVARLHRDPGAHEPAQGPAPSAPCAARR